MCSLFMMRRAVDSFLTMMLTNLSGGIASYTYSGVHDIEV